MLTETRAKNILRTLQTLPGERVAEVEEFINALKQGCDSSKRADERDFWSEDDLRDIALAALNYAAQVD